MTFSNGVNSLWFCSKYQLLNHTGLFRKHPSKPEYDKLCWNFGVVKGAEILTVSKTTPCRDNAMLSSPHNCPLWGNPYSSNQTLTLWVNRAAAVPGTAAGVKPGVSLIYRACLKSHFTWGNSPSHSLHQLQPDRRLQATWACARLYTRMCVWLHCHPPGTDFPGISWAACELAGHDQQHKIAAGLSIYSSLGQEERNGGLWHRWLEGGYALSLFRASPAWAHSAAPGG